MVRPAQTARSERTREALRKAAVVRFLAQGVEETSAEQIAAGAGGSARTFSCHLLPPLPLQARSAVGRLHRIALVPHRAGWQARRRTDHRFRAVGHLCVSL